jgi:hypothetical protein
MWKLETFLAWCCSQYNILMGGLRTQQPTIEASGKGDWWPEQEQENSG